MTIKKATQASNVRMHDNPARASLQTDKRPDKDKKLQEKCIFRITSATDSIRKEVWENRLWMSNQRFDLLTVRRCPLGRQGKQRTIMREATEDQLYDIDYSDSEEDDSDNDDEASINANPTDKKTEKETSGKKILRLTAFTKKQLLART
jgi:hypothetical protein